MSDKQDSDVEDEFMQRIVAVLQRRKELSFDESVREYRQVEAEFVARAGDNEARALATKQSITNHLLMEAERTEQPHAVCRELWEELIQRGFISINLRHVMSSTYARSCQWNGEFDVGIAVLEPLIAELDVLLMQPALTPNHRAFCEQFLRLHTGLRDELVAGIRE
jgi:hypothetical protein